MGQIGNNDRWGAFPALLLGVATALLCLAALCLASPVLAAYEQLPGSEGIFGGAAAPAPEGKFGEEVQLGGASALAVNRTGAGGVKAGTVYAVTEGPAVAEKPRVAMFEPEEGGGLLLAEGWQVTELEEPYERCGPLVGTIELGGRKVAEHPCAPRPTSEPQGLGIAVDQSTGYVYVYGQFHAENEKREYRPGVDQVVVYAPDGSRVVTRFGEQAPPGQSVAESPSKHHRVFTADVLAVNGAGEAFVDDELRSGEPYHRLMVFRPHEGNFEHYEYAGEVAAGNNEERIPRAPVFDEAGNLYVAGTDGSGDHVEELAHETPGAYPSMASPAVCEYQYSKGGLQAMTVDPVTGEPVFFSNKNPLRIRRLGSCDEATHEFAGAGSPEEIALSPQPEFVYAMAVDPGRQSTAARPAGELYAAEAFPTQSEGEEVGHSALGYVFAHPAELAPKINAEAVDHVGASSAVAHATVDPNSFRTSYAFEYVTAAEYEAHGFEGAKEAPLGGSHIEGASGVQSVTAAIGPLMPETAYRFRVVVSSECRGNGQPLCLAEGEAAEFGTYPSGVALLPDGRAWELVSPAQKSGGQVLPADPLISTCKVIECKPGAAYTHFPMQSSPDGEAVAYEGTNFGIGGPATENEYVAQRSASGWQSADLTPALMSKAERYNGLTPTLGQATLERAPGATPLAGGAPAGYANLYSQPSGDPAALSPLLGEAPPHRDTSEFVVKFAATSSDGQRVFFAANDALTTLTAVAPEAVDGGAGKFNLYEWHEGKLSLVNVKPGDTETEPGASFSSASANTVSVDGNSAFWSDEAGRVYVRIGGTETRRIEDPGGGHLLSASTDGARALLSDGCLYDVAAGVCSDLSEGKGGFEGVLGQSSDLSHVYFVDSEVLDSSPNPQGETAETGAHNLYARRSGGTARFVARLAATDNGNETVGDGKLVDWAKVPANRTAEASPDGRYLAFLSGQALTGRNNVGPCQEISGTGVFEHVACPEAFVYDSETDRLACASCNPSGAAPLGLTVLRRILGAAFAPQPRYLTDSGRLYFDSQDSLSPLDTNEGVEDVYEWEPRGVGGCASDFAEGGCVALLSAGREGVDSNLVTVDETGKNVFFTTRDRLASTDKDELIDLYDAREAGGFQSETILPPHPCMGDTCQGSAEQSIFATPPATIGFTGPGNIALQSAPPAPVIHKAKKAAKCPRGKVRKRGRCVKVKHSRRRGRSSQSRASRNRGGTK
jgi:hypothetical protein